MEYISEYNCPTCNSEPPDSEYRATKYKVKYPKYTTPVHSYNGWNDMIYWDETHYCKKCKTEFTFSNSN